ncbi:MAG: helix-turn-helix transcriptional regulator [Treponema sp.]|uniref:helix-turn-helix domain-containing protein n=1 Tax=Treponema sp. TaxID=166 RepID=UPI0025FB050F|nr:helix-turn-helix domain-containing protein [Treponema sp.]MBR0496207.1 helix-turn-helix transcriptional regulator [Treponema sp.]
METKQKLFKQRLSDELNYQGISKLDFAERIGISINTLNMYLYRGSIPAADVAVRMAQALNTTTEYLVTGSDSTTPPSKSGTKSDWQKKEINHILGSLNPHQLTHFLEIARAYKNGVTED